MQIRPDVLPDDFSDEARAGSRLGLGEAQVLGADLGGNVVYKLYNMVNSKFPILH